MRYQTEMKRRPQKKKISQILKLLFVPFLIFHLASSNNIFSILCNDPNLFAAAQSSDIIESMQPWQDWNYYQLLNLQPEDYYKQGKSKFRLKSKSERRKERSVIQAKDIKKAYRKQAQLWHPDKITSRKNQQGNATSTNGIDYASLSVEQCNARFAKIADAYEVLNDNDKRIDYDSFLLDAEEQMEREHKRAQVQSGQASNGDSASTSDYFFQATNDFFGDFFTDPMSTFEHFFFGDGDDHDQENDRTFMDDRFDSFYDGSQRNHQNNRHYNRQPDRTSESTHVEYDSRFGTETLRVLQREEFDEPQESRIYFRVIGQEFIEEFDQFYGQSLGYQPISEPYLVEEGHLPYRERRRTSESSFNKQHRKQPRHRRPISITSHRLEKYEYITAKSIHLHSANGEYYAGITPECELVIMHEEGPFEEDTEVWGSSTFVPPQYRDGCALAMYGARIAIVVGNVENPTTVLWTSPPPPPIVPGSPFDGEEIIDYFCSLDDDGSLTVYRTRERKNLSLTGRDLVSIAEMWWSDLVAGEAATPPKSNAAHTWKSIQRWTHLKTSGKPQKIWREGKKKEKHEDECVFATGPAGCNTAGRHVINISKTIKKYADKAVSQLDDKVGGFVDSLYDGGEDDADLLDTLLRVGTNFSQSASASFSRAIQVFIPYATETMIEIRYRISKLSSILHYEINEFTEKAHHKIRRSKKYLKRKLDELMNDWEL